MSFLPEPSCAVAVMTVSPMPIAVTNPFSSTVAIFSLSLLQTTLVSSASSGSAVAVRRTVESLAMEISCLSRLMETTSLYEMPRML